MAALHCRACNPGHAEQPASLVTCGGARKARQHAKRVRLLPDQSLEDEVEEEVEVEEDKLETLEFAEGLKG